jgi:hypothetical protein
MQTAESREFNYGKEGIVMGQKNLKQRTKEFALSVIRLVKALPKVKTADVLADSYYQALAQRGIHLSGH